MVDAKLEGGCRFESCCVYLDEKHIASTAERSLINYYRFESCPDYDCKCDGNTRKTQIQCPMRK